ncbi:nucleotidyl transferase AbiEii/AbiGii toxin family protein [Thermococcus stetteri]|uniref:nucleotidyl transferase AbiEii/AbiGii toxin family protein n=1 Tax=Thermococcus stetteri TaxID=49900 RepID=UPI001AE1E585|nr:nucleotidyl transferase AbiEii/AbiGii toxin family protein [Thermococcus stetteri]MBP1911681.1 putative nucleotidyltransferase component of viral defense system [Thermococcus stetteri]
MKDYSEFIQLIIEKSGIKKPELIEKDIVLHTILKRLYSDEYFAENYLFKGGTCLVKCYFGYYRFSVDLDFTFKNQEKWKGLSKRSKRKALVKEAQGVSNLIKAAASYVGLEFNADLQNRRYIEFGSGSRMITYKLYYPGGLIKVQVNLIENVLFEPKRLTAKTLLSGVSLSRNDRLYFYDFLGDYSEVEVLAYDLREILVEKVRAILTRKVQKLRDFYDLYLLYRHGLRVSEHREAIIKKVIPALRYEKYLENFRRNKASFDMRVDSILDEYELRLLNVEPDENFVSFFNSLAKDIVEILDEVEV